MTYRDRASSARVVVAAIAYLCTGAACGSPQAASDAGNGPTSDAGAGSCSANVPHGQVCNTLTNVGTTVTPTCATGTIPIGTGGTIVDGTYTLTSQTYYGATTCPSELVNATLEIAGGCIQEVSSAPIPVTVSTASTVAGTTITKTVTCIALGIDAGPLSADFSTDTFTATPTTFTIFIKNSSTSSANPDRVETYQKR
jgi:hypothetical protein